MALLEKGAEFEEVAIAPGREEEFLTRSPAGKIPFVEVEGGYLAETRAILTYLEVQHPDPALLPGDPFLAGLADQIYLHIHNYLDSAVRPLFPAAFFGATAEPALVQEGLEKARFGVQGLKRLVKFSPFIAGEHLTLADLAAFNSLPLVGRALKALGQDDPLAGWKEWKPYLERIGSRPSASRVYGNFKKAVAARGL